MQNSFSIDLRPTRHPRRAGSPPASLVAGQVQLVWFMLMALLTAPSPVVWAQRAPLHYFHSSQLPPGAVGQGQLLRGGPRAGYFQPVEMSVPEDSWISLAVDGQFDQPQENRALAGMLIGQVYRLKIGNIQFHEGQEVYPTIEVIDRLYPPEGLAHRFPIPVQFTFEELELALNGHYVTRVIYLEDPTNALGYAQDPRHQRYFEVGSKQDPLEVADRLGRPMAIMRMGSRLPNIDSVTGQCLFDTPPLIKLAIPPAPQTQPRHSTASAIERIHQEYPRVPLREPRADQLRR